MTLSVEKEQREYTINWLKSRKRQAQSRIKEIMRARIQNAVYWEDLRIDFFKDEIDLCDKHLKKIEDASD